MLISLLKNVCRFKIQHKFMTQMITIVSCCAVLKYHIKVALKGQMQK